VYKNSKKLFLKNTKVDSLNKKEIEIFHSYFLTASERKKESIRKKLTPDELNHLEIVGACLDGDGNLGRAVLEAGMLDAQDELEELQFSYYLWQAEQYVKGEKNASIEKLLSANNWLFKEAIAFEADEEGINKGLTTAIRRTEREALKKQLLAIDMESDPQLSGTETRNNVIPLTDTSPQRETEQNKRRFIRYVAAALIIGAVSIITFLLLNRTKKPGISQKEIPADQIKIKKTHFEKYSPNIIADNIVVKAIEPAGFGYAGSKALQYNIEIQHIEKQIATLKKWYEINYEAGAETSQKNTQIDSMVSCINTYLFNDEKSKLVLKLGEESKVDQVIIPDPLHRHTIFIQLNKRFYEIKSAKTPLKLMPVADKQLIESLQKIVFQNS
jgi:hypothetical protein